MPVPEYCCIFLFIGTLLKVNQRRCYIYHKYIEKYSLNTQNTLITNIMISISREYHDNIILYSSRYKDYEEHCGHWA